MVKILIWKIKSIRFRYGRKFDRLVRSDYWRRRVHPGDFGNGVEDFRKFPRSQNPGAAFCGKAYGARDVGKARQTNYAHAKPVFDIAQIRLAAFGRKRFGFGTQSLQTSGEGRFGKVDMFGIGRAILHMNKRRGFKSNRKADKKSDGAESRGMKLGISKLREAMGDRTLGEFLYERKNPAWERE